MKVKLPRERSSSSLRGKKLLTLAIGFFIIMIMVLSVLDLWSGSSDKYTYHGIKFTKGDNGWSAYINKNPVVLPYSPQELENVREVDFSGFNSLEKIYLTTDNPFKMSKSMDHFRNKLPSSAPKIFACTPDASNVTGCESLTLKYCEDATSSVGVIIFKNSESFSSSFITNNCLLLQGDNEVLAKVLDKAVLKMRGA